MLLQTYIAASALASGALAGVMNNVMNNFMNNRPVRCNAPEMTEERAAWVKKFADEEARARKDGKPVIQADIPIRVYLHTIAATESNLLSDEVLKKQMNVMTNDYSKTGFNMTFAGSSKTLNETWAKDGDTSAMKKALRRGSYRDLNLYFVEEMGALGYCTFPTKLATPGSDAFYADGCVNVASSVPGGSAPFDMGRTAVHEAGHWMGLDHVFLNGCDSPGDSVDDTPAQKEASWGCMKGADTCPDQPGLDPINNFMGYSDDACYEEFTAGQKERMMSFWKEFREGN